MPTSTVAASAPFITNMLRHRAARSDSFRNLVILFPPFILRGSDPALRFRGLDRGSGKLFFVFSD
jgi:hypothetical protein